jgi:hypothetical protein
MAIGPRVRTPAAIGSEIATAIAIVATAGIVATGIGRAMPAAMVSVKVVGMASAMDVATDAHAARGRHAARRARDSLTASRASSVLSRPRVTIKPPARIR